MPDAVRYVSATVGRRGHERQVEIPVRNNAFAIAAEQPVVVTALGRRD